MCTYVHARVCMHVCVWVCVVGGCVGSEAVKSWESHSQVTQGAVKSSHVKVRECLRETVSGGSVVVVGVDGKDRIVVKKVGCAQRVPWPELCEDCVT